MRTLYLYINLRRSRDSARLSLFGRVFVCYLPRSSLHSVRFGQLLRCAHQHIVNIMKVYMEKVWFYIALYPVRWTAQSALHFPPLADLFIPTPFSASLGSILAMQQLRNDYSLTFPPLSIARYSFIQLSRLRRREVKENAQTSKR